MPNGIDFELLHTEEEYNTKKDYYYKDLGLDSLYLNKNRKSV